ncbi:MULTISPECIES: hypothetical protein [Pontibacillus]|uniref:DUF4179 domain-containing protein n=1 Tax=Pontibacillus chungwhensis TaxID=265426 RepID=A0ABY8UW26_9BACI|nr:MULTISPECIES: hypothetical protein [Pontibacillus]MCD5323239.1 hypothetical protein [Pontibacillus sp. HN14]WIF96625.1 hypothetical protein QNI29_12780 [Pontibacillus chungwhensis]
MRNRITIAIIMILLIGIGLYTSMDTPEEIQPIDLESVKVAHNMDEVKNFYYQNLSGLKRAESLGLTEDIDKTYDVGGIDGEITFDEAWYNGKNLYVLYHRKVSSVGIGTSPNGEEQPVPHLYSEENTPYTIEVNQQLSPLIVLTSGLARGKGIQLNNRFYSSLTLAVPQDVKVIGENALVNGTSMVNINGESKEVTFSFKIDAKEDVVERFELSQTFTYKNVSVTLDSIEMGTFGTKLFTHINHPKGGRPKEIQIAASTPDSEQIEFVQRLVPNKETREVTNDYILNGFEAVHSIPKSLDITLKSIQLNGHKDFSFKMDTTRLPQGLGENDSYEEHPNEVIKKIDDSAVSLSSIKYDRDYLSFTLARKSMNSLNAPYKTISFHTGPKVSGVANETESPFSVDASKADGSEIPIGYTGNRAEVNNGEEKLRFNIPSEAIVNSPYITVSLTNLPSKVVFDERRMVKLN